MHLPNQNNRISYNDYKKTSLQDPFKFLVILKLFDISISQYDYTRSYIIHN